jgi:sugar lactone lactonase YvrE
MVMSLLLTCFSATRATQMNSVYTQRPDDPEALYFAPPTYAINADGKGDVSAELQRAINDVKRLRNFGILFVPEGRYRLSRTIYIPPGVRLIGYGKRRPEFILAARSPGFDREVPADKGKAKYLFWFTGGMVENDANGRVPDASAGTFYSAMSNVDIRIEKGNPHAVALRTHYAQHSFVSYMTIWIGEGKAGLFDAGNEMENVAFYGGDYGIYTTKSSPGWPVMLVDATFEGQRKAAIRCQESGLAMVNLHVSRVPRVFDIDANYCDKLFLENSYISDVSEALVSVANENNSNNQINFRDVYCRDVPVLASYARSGTRTEVAHKIYLIRDYTHGLCLESLDAEPAYRTTVRTEAVGRMPQAPANDLPRLAGMGTWVNIRDLGAKGDNVADDTQAFQAAIDKYDHIYVPQGWYRLTKTLRLRANTQLIGLHPYGTQLRLDNGTAAFSGFGAPVAMVETARGGNAALNGIGIDTGQYNYRAVGVKWMAGAGSYLNDVKFVGGHGGMRKPGATEPRDAAQRRAWSDQHLAWDSQYWSLWVTDGGGGTFKDIWSASTFASAGFYAERTRTPARVYAMSVEHHVREEVRFNDVANWKVYALQTEEESRESTECQPIEMDGCRDITFANLYMFRVIRVNKPYYSSVRMRGCAAIDFLNLHNYAQTQYANTIAVYDAGKDIDIRPWELARLTVTGKEKSRHTPPAAEGEVTTIGSDFEFAQGVAADSRGNVYFCDQRMRRVYRWRAETGTLSLVADFPWKPACLAVDTEDHLLVLFRYDPQPGWNVDGKPAETVVNLPDAGGTSFSGWGNSGFEMRVYAIDPDAPEKTIRQLPRVERGTVRTVAKALYPANRWRDFHDFNDVTTRVPSHCFVAPDGVTIIPHCYDLARCSSLLPAWPGKPFYASDEYDRRVVRCDVAADGTLTNLTYFAEQGEMGLATDRDGNVYVADGQIYIFNPNGERTRMIRIPERPSTLVVGGAEGNMLFITGRAKLFAVKL